MESIEQLLERYNDTVSFSSPKPVDCYSVNKSRELVDDLRCLRYFVYPSEFNLNLNNGFKSFIKKPESAKHEKINHLLQFILKNKVLLNPSSDKVLETDFLCFRGLFTLLLKTPYERDNWTICAVKWKGTIYLCEFDKHEFSFDKADLFNYYGHKFEHYTLFDSPKKSTPSKEPVNECEEFCVLFQSVFNNFKLLYGAEVDGIISDEIQVDKTFLLNANFIELKTNRMIENQRQDFSFHKHKLLKFWAQSFLVGIKTIMVGYRTDNGILKKILPLSVEDIPKKCQELWNSEKCLKFLNAFLCTVKEVLNETDDYKTVWKFEYNSKNKQVIFEKTVKSKYLILPSWYVEEILKISK